MIQHTSISPFQILSLIISVLKNKFTHNTSGRGSRNIKTLHILAYVYLHLGSFLAFLKTHLQTTSTSVGFLWGYTLAQLFLWS